MKHEAEWIPLMIDSVSRQSDRHCAGRGRFPILVSRTDAV